MIPMKVVCGSNNIMRKVIKFPDGREIIVKPGKPYIAYSKKDIDFLSRQRDIMMYPMDMEECRTYLIKNDLIPSIDVELSIEEAKKFVWHDEDEEYVLDILKSKGYLIDRVGTDPIFISDEKTRNNLAKCTNESLLKELQSRIENDSSLKVTASKLIDVELSNNVDDLTVPELKEYLKVKRNIVGLREI